MLASLERVASKLEERKKEASKLRRKGERELKKARSLLRRSTSGLATVARKVENAREELSDVAGVLTQKLAQKESIERLVTTAKDRVSKEKEALEQALQELDFASSDEEKQSAQSRINSLNQHIADLEDEIKERDKTLRKITDAIDDIQSNKSKISGKIQKQTKVKPTLQKMLKESKKDAERFSKQVVVKAKQEESAKNTLIKVKEKLEKVKAQKRKLAAKKRSRKAKPKKRSKKASKPKRKSAKKTATRKAKPKKRSKKASKPKRKSVKKSRR
ncbi:MAG: ATPase V [Crenarchaeota archaeon]|nr:MAG: ATPase V [Thermoproteota archaeon]